MNSPGDEVDKPHVSTPVNPYWKSVIVTGFLFCGTTLAIVMTQFGEPRSPANIFLRRHGALLAAVEVGAVLLCGVMAMATDQRQSRDAARHVRPADRPVPPAVGESPDVG